MDYQEARKLLHPDTTRDAIWKIADKQEAIKKINEACVIACDAIDELQEYKQLGALEEVREAVEKQNAIEPEDEEYCPLCHTFLKDDDGVPGYYCPNCGQAIHWKDWSDEE